MLNVPSFAQPIDINPLVDPLHELVFASLAMCDIDCRKELASNIILIGGGTLLDGLQARLQADLATLLPGHMKVPFLIHVTGL
jgi:actin-related protein